MKKVIIGTNWKMHKTIDEGKVYSQKISEIYDKLNEENIQLFFIPPHTSLVPIKEQMNPKIWLGAQNMHWEEEGAFTGEISPLMLKEIGIDLIELGHSERRQYYNENDSDLNKKVHAALKFNITPLLCIGETLEHKNHGISKEILSMQLKVCLHGVSEDQVENILIAYEPVWAIGAGSIEAEPMYVHEIHDNIRQVLVELFPKTGHDIPILFGGSVNGRNAVSYLKGPQVNGLFIGRSAWDLEKFELILRDVKDYISRN